MVVKTTITTFTEFVNATGSAKITKVKAAKEFVSDPTDFVMKSFYLPWKQEIRKAMEAGVDPTVIAGAAVVGPDARHAHFQTCSDGMLRWMGRKRIVWTGVSNRYWSSGGLTVTVNPELGVEINGVPFVIKLHLKDDPVTKRAIDPALHLMELVYPHHDVGILDVRRAKLFTPTRLIPGIDALLAGEAASFATMWVAM